MTYIKVTQKHWSGEHGYNRFYTPTNQRYKDNPNWLTIRVDEGCRNFSYFCLPLVNKGLLDVIIRLTASCSNKLPLDLFFIKSKCGIKENFSDEELLELLQSLVTAGFIETYDEPDNKCIQDADKCLHDVDKCSSLNLNLNLNLNRNETYVPDALAPELESAPKKKKQPKETEPCNPEVTRLKDFYCDQFKALDASHCFPLNANIAILTKWLKANHSAWDVFEQKTRVWFTGKIFPNRADVPEKNFSVKTFLSVYDSIPLTIPLSKDEIEEAEKRRSVAEWGF